MMTGIAFALLGFFSMSGFALGVLMERGSVRRIRQHLEDRNEVLADELEDLRWKLKYYQNAEKKESAKKVWSPDYVIQEAV